MIDWEDAAFGDPLIDLAQTRAEIAWIFGRDALYAFTQRHQSAMDLDYVNLPHRDLCATLRFIRFAQGDLAEIAAFFKPYGREDITEQTIGNNYRYFIDQAFAALDLS